MKGDETKGSRSEPKNAPGKASAARYEQVFDGRKSRVRGLWKRGEVFYARFSASDHTRRARDTFRSLEGVTTVPAAKAALQNLKTEASKRSIPPMDAALRSQKSGPGTCRKSPAPSAPPLSARNEPTSHGGRRASEPCRSLKSIAPTSTRESPTASVSHN